LHDGFILVYLDLVDFSVLSGETWEYAAPFRPIVTISNEFPFPGFSGIECIHTNHLRSFIHAMGPLLRICPRIQPFDRTAVRKPS
jgi:hypothetical protein